MKINPILFLLAIFTVSLAASCGDDDAPLGPTTTVNMNWTGVYETDPLVMINDAYKYPDGRQVTFKDVNFFISNVSLLEAETGDEVELIEVEYVDFSNNTSTAEAEQPITFVTNLVPVGNYKGIRIGFGVPEDLNNENANQFGAGHPLRKNFGQFWSDWESFIFTMINGQYDENGDGVFDASDPGFSHHLGSDAVYRTVTIDKQFQLVEGESFDLNVVFDLRKFYARSDSDYFDMTDPANRHTNDPSDLTVAEYMVENFKTAVSVE